MSISKLLFLSLESGLGRMWFIEASSEELTTSEGAFLGDSWEDAGPGRASARWAFDLI